MPYIGKADAEALARRWVDGEVHPEDFDPSIAEWKLDETIREMVKTGDISKKQVVEEVQRRKRAGYFDNQQEPFVDKYPVKGVK